MTLQYTLVDFHCHLDLYADYPAILDECEEMRIHTLAVTTTPEAWSRNRDMASRIKYVRAALGLHPQLVEERFKEIDLLESYINETNYIGEVGLDAGPRFFKSINLQKSIFERVLRVCANAGGKIISVHSVRSVRMILDMIEAILPSSKGQVVLHWFTGSDSEARRALDLGCYFSINAEMLKNPRRQEMIKAFPVNRLLTETDGPFCMREGVPIRPTDVLATTESLAKTKGLSTQDMADHIFSNLLSLEHHIDKPVNKI